MSMKTKSVLSIKLNLLGESVKGGPGVVAPSAVCTRIGANEPIRSQIVELPGPPLYKNVTGRCVDSEPSSVNAV
jgi:hypothetical protein